jgi:hypothetical protein
MCYFDLPRNAVWWRTLVRRAHATTAVELVMVLYDWHTRCRVVQQSCILVTPSCVRLKKLSRKTGTVRTVVKHWKGRPL